MQGAETMTIRWRPVKLWRDETGQTTIEYALLLAAVALPMIVVFRMLLALLAWLYEMTVFLIGMPFP